MEEGRSERNSVEIGDGRETKGRKNISRMLFNKIERSMWHQSSKLTSGQAQRKGLLSSAMTRAIQENE